MKNKRLWIAITSILSLLTMLLLPLYKNYFDETLWSIVASEFRLDDSTAAIKIFSSQSLFYKKVSYVYGELYVYVLRGILGLMILTQLITLVKAIKATKLKDVSAWGTISGSYQFVMGILIAFCIVIKRMQPWQSYVCIYYPDKPGIGTYALIAIGAVQLFVALRKKKSKDKDVIDMLAGM